MDIMLTSIQVQMTFDQHNYIKCGTGNNQSVEAHVWNGCLPDEQATKTRMAFGAKRNIPHVTNFKPFITYLINTAFISSIDEYILNCNISSCFSCHSMFCNLHDDIMPIIETTSFSNHPMAQVGQLWFERQRIVSWLTTHTTSHAACPICCASMHIAQR